MNIRSFMVLVACVTGSVSACVVVGPSGSTSTDGAGGSDPTGGGVGGGGGTVQCDDKLTCAGAITPPGDPADLCEGPSAELYDALQKCSCEGACAAACSATSCAGKPAAAECTTCLQNSATGCAKESDACAGDF